MYGYSTHMPALILLLLMLAPIAIHAQSSTCAPPPLVITNTAIFDGDRLLTNREILFAGGRVVASGRVDKLKRPPGARVIDARGDTLLPGLIDAHAHMFELGGPSPREVYESPREKAFPITGRQLLRSGVTTARVHLFDLVHGPALKRDAANDCFPSPRLQIGGPGMTGGQPDMSSIIFTGYKSLDDARAKVAAMRHAGADWIALHGLNRYPPGDLEAIVSDARKQGLRIMAEGDPVAHAEIALRNKVDSIEYLDRSQNGEYSAEFIRRLRQSPVYLVPPIGYFNRAAEARRHPEVAPDPIYFSFMPDKMAKEMAERRQKWILAADRADAWMDQINYRFQVLARSGVKIATGTDCGSPENFQIDAIWWELETRRKLGFSTIDAVRAASATTAGLLQVPDIGHLRPGARADFVLYTGDVRSGPLEGKRVRTVAKGGMLYVDEGQWVGP